MGLSWLRTIRCLEDRSLAVFCPVWHFRLAVENYGLDLAGRAGIVRNHAAGSGFTLEHSLCGTKSGEWLGLVLRGPTHHVTGIFRVFYVTLVAMESWEHHCVSESWRRCLSAQNVGIMVQVISPGPYSHRYLLLYVLMIICSSWGVQME